MTYKKLLFPVLLISLSFTCLILAKPVLAISFEDIVTGAKKFILGGEKKDITIDSKIELAPNGDVEKNGQIDAGDIVKFTYQIKNNTEKSYSFATLKTNIDTKQLHYIHNLYGATGIINTPTTVTFPNFKISSNEQVTIAFDARINYFTESDPIISTEAEFIDKDNNLLVKAEKKEMKALRTKKDSIPGLIKSNHKHD